MVNRKFRLKTIGYIDIGDGWKWIGTFQVLTVTVRAGSRLPKSSKILIKAEMSTIAKMAQETLPDFLEEISTEMNRK